MISSKKYLVPSIVFGIFLSNSLSAAVHVTIQKPNDDSSMPTRALQSPVGGVNFAQSVFNNGTGYFGDSVGGKGADALISAQLTGNAQTGYTITTKQLAANDATINTLDGAKIAHLSLIDNNPVVVQQGDMSIISINTQTKTATLTKSVTDAGGEPINAPPYNLSAGKIGDHFLVFSAVSDAKKGGGIRWKTGADLTAPVEDKDSAAAATAVGAAAAAIAPAKPIAKHAADLIADEITKNTNATGLTTNIKQSIDNVADIDQVANKLKIHETVTALAADINANNIVTNIATVISPTPDQIKNAIFNKPIKAGATIDAPGTAVHVANKVLTDHIDDPSALIQITYNELDKNTFVTGAGAALAAGAAWAIRSAPAVGNPDVATLFKAGEDALNLAAAGAELPVAKYTADKVKLHNDVKAAANAYIKFDAAVDTAPLSVRVLSAAATTQADIVANNITGQLVATKVASALEPLFKVDPAGHGAAILPNDVRVTNEALASLASDDVPLDAIAGIVVNDTATLGATAALEAMLARGVAGYQLPTKDAADFAAKAETVVDDLSTINKALLPKLKALVVDKPIAQATIDAIKVNTDANGGSTINAALLAAIKPAVKDGNFNGGGENADNTRIAKAATAIKDYANADKIAVANDFLAPIAQAATSAANTANRTAIVTAIDPDAALRMVAASFLRAEANDPATLASIVEKIIADAPGGTIDRDDNAQTGAAIAIEAGTTWALRNQSALGATQAATLFGAAATQAQDDLNKGYQGGGGDKKTIAAAEVAKVNVNAVKDAADLLIPAFAPDDNTNFLTMRVMNAAAEAQSHALKLDLIASQINNALTNQYKVNQVNLVLNVDQTRALALNPNDNLASPILIAAVLPVADDDTLTKGAIAALEAAVGRGLGQYQLGTKNDAGDVDQAATTAQNVSNAITPAINALKGAMIKDSALVTYKPVAAAAVQAIAADIAIAQPTIDFFTVIKNAITDGINSRIAKAAEKAHEYIVNNAIPNAVLGLNGAGNYMCTEQLLLKVAGVTPDLNTIQLNSNTKNPTWNTSIAAVAKCEQIRNQSPNDKGAVDCAVDQAAARVNYKTGIVAYDKKTLVAQGIQAAMAAAIGWAIRKTKYEQLADYNAINENVTEALAALLQSTKKTHAMLIFNNQNNKVNKNMYDAAKAVSNTPDAKAALAKIAKAALLYAFDQNIASINAAGELKPPTQKAVNSLFYTPMENNGNNDGIAAIKGLFDNADRIKAIAKTDTVVSADAAAVTNTYADALLVANDDTEKSFKEIVLMATRNATEACLGWGVRAATLDTSDDDLENILATVLNDGKMQNSLDSTKQIAQNVVGVLKSHNNTITALKILITAGLISGTEAAVAAMRTQLKKDPALNLATLGSAFVDTVVSTLYPGVTVANLQTAIPDAIGLKAIAGQEQILANAVPGGADEAASAIKTAITTTKGLGGAANTAVTGAQAATLAALGWGIRAATGDSDDTAIKAIVSDALTQCAACTTDLGGTAFNALANAIPVVNGIKNNAKAQTALASAIAAAIGKANGQVAGLLAAAVPDAVKDAVVTVVNDALEIKINDVKNAVGADRIKAIAKIAPTALGTKSKDAATEAAKNVQADGADAKAIGIAAAASAIEGCCGWGVRNITMDKVWGENAKGEAIANDKVTALFTTGVNGTGILDNNMQQAIAGADKTIAQGVVTAIKCDADSLSALAATVVAGVKQGTNDAADALATAMKTEANTAAYTITQAAAAPLKLTADQVLNGLGVGIVTRLDAGRIENAAVGASLEANDGNGARAAGEKATAALANAANHYVANAAAPVQGTDDPTTGALAAIEAATGYLIGRLSKAGKDATQGLAVTPWNTQYLNDGVERGISVLNAKNNLAPVKQGTNQNSAQALSLAAEAETTNHRVKPVAFYAAGGTNIDSAHLGGNAPSMYTDPALNCIFVGLQNVQRGKTNGTGVVVANDKQGGVIGVLVGSVNPVDKKLTLKPILHKPTAAMLAAAGKEIFGFYAATNTNANMQTTIYNTRTMHTSTGKDYIIINGDTRVAADIDKSKSWIYALPIMPKGDPNAGQLAKKDFTAVASDALDLYTVDQANNIANFNMDNEQPVVVGRDPRLLGGTDTNKQPTAVNVFGDTVYVSMAETRAAAANSENKVKTEAGIFASTAIFDDTGIIKNWTPWKRVGGTTYPVYGFGMDPSAVTIPYVTGAVGGAHIDTIKSSAWGQSSQVTDPATSRKLTDVLSTIFKDVGGVFQIYNFDENTPGFALGKCSMMVAVGPDRIALIQTGAWSATKFEPTTEFKANGLDKNVFVFNASNYPALKDIAPLTCAEVLRDGVTADSGYLYIGGYRGLARLELANGNGWAIPLAALAATTADTFPGGAHWTFKKVDAWNGSYVVSMAGGGANNLQVLAFEKMCKAATTGAPTATNQLDSINGQFGCDTILVDNKVIFATTTGLYVANDTLTDPTKVAYIPDTMIPVQLSYIASGLDGTSTKGNLYVLAIDKTQEISTVYRFYVDSTAVALAGVIKPIAGQDGKFPLTLDNYARQFATDGSVLLTVRSGGEGITDTVAVGLMRGGGSDDITMLPQANLDISTNTRSSYVARPVKDSATGAWILPGDFGARVNE